MKCKQLLALLFGGVLSSSVTFGNLHPNSKGEIIIEESDLHNGGVDFASLQESERVQVTTILLGESANTKLTHLEISEGMLPALQWLMLRNQALTHLSIPSEMAARSYQLLDQSAQDGDVDTAARYAKVAQDVTIFFQKKTIERRGSLFFSRHGSTQKTDEKSKEEQKQERDRRLAAKIAVCFPQDENPHF